MTQAPAGSSGPARAAVAPPTPGIDKTGFIDNTDGANLRTGPAEAGGRLVRDQPLPPATRVFVSGTHPAASGWWYVTAFLDRVMVGGYVQGLRINIDLPEPLARLHVVQSGETVEKLAAQEFGHAVRDGHDLRYYENVLLYVNRTYPPRSRPGIAGTYQEPGALGGGGNHIQLYAGNRIWLVHPEYARALESIVPSGSLTGGALAKAQRFGNRLEDIVHSVTESRHHLDEVAGELADAIREHLPRIVGIVAGFLVAELGSAALAATPTGVTQGLAVVIQLALSALGAASMVEAGAEALRLGVRWLTMAWAARGKAEQIIEASKEFLRMLVAVAIAALGLLGARGNYRNAMKIARQMPPGGLPVPVPAAARRAGTRRRGRVCGSAPAPERSVRGARRWSGMATRALARLPRRTASRRTARRTLPGAPTTRPRRAPRRRAFPTKRRCWRPRPPGPRAGASRSGRSPRRPSRLR